MEEEEDKDTQAQEHNKQGGEGGEQPGNSELDLVSPTVGEYAYVHKFVFITLFLLFIE